MALTKALDSSQIWARIDGFVAVVIDFWKRGRIDELIGLTIQAGFEQGKLGIDFLWDQLKSLFSSGSAWRLILNFAMTLTREIANAFVDLSVFLGSSLANITAVIFQKIQDQAVAGINAIINTINKSGKLTYLLGGSIEPLGSSSLAKEAGQQAAEIKAGGEVLKEAISNFFNKGIAGSNSLFGGQGEATSNATERLKQLIDAQIKLRDEAKKTAEIVEDTTAAVAAFDVKQFLATQELELKKKLLELEKARALIEGDFRKTTQEKWALRREQLEKERDALNELITKLREQAAITDDLAAKQALNQRADAAQEKLVGVEGDMAGLGPNPKSFTENFSANLWSLSSEIGTFSQSAATMLSNGLGLAIRGVSDAIMGAIDGTRTWGQVFADVGRQIIASMIQVVVNWIAQMTVLALLKKIFQQEENKAAAQSAAAWGPAAVAASIATVGAAAAIGTAAAIAGMTAGAVAGGALGTGAGFSEGGWTGPGGKYEVAGVVHRNEFVVPARDVDRLGGPAGVAALVQGGPRYVESKQPAPVVKVIAVYDPKSAAAEYLNTPQGEHAVIALVGRNRSELGMQT